MFREMRRKRQVLLPEEIHAVLDRGTSGGLALSGDDDYPYAVPISYVYDGEKIYFHCAKSGHKLDAIQRNERASFCVIDQDQIMPEEYTSYFRSVIVFGRIHIIEDEAKKRLAIEKLALKYAPDDQKIHREQAIERDWKPLCMLEMTIDHMSGKEAIELIKNKQVKK
ncbi:pyridoxamine 5'-phosphate oxidase family protein [uncultured Faecalicoccus sp.]|uniref:pyridoxamine 5'-phosphate oxidase family protein n=1 Tax=uncultured Faecalicoccus sp. TaxID=1971760 RepID=UPI0025CD08E2|nr:pyridoxamine 5'-phosphate oxidase family protein [uncultured Faecalicoccus sp.]